MCNQFDRVTFPYRRAKWGGPLVLPCGKILRIRKQEKKLIGIFLLKGAWGGLDVAAFRRQVAQRGKCECLMKPHLQAG